MTKSSEADARLPGRGILLMITGYGRSGSSITETELALRAGAVSMGEVRYLPDRIRDLGGRCGCGASYSKCQLWSCMVSDAPSLDPSVEPLRSEHLIIAGIRIFGRSRAKNVAMLYDTVRARMSPRSVLVDSSKTAWGSMLRPVRVAGSLERSRWGVATIGIYRDPVEVYESMLRGRNETMAGRSSRQSRYAFIRCLLGWTAANTALLSIHYWRWVTGRPCIVRSLRSLISGFDLLEALQLPVSDAGIAAHPVGGNRLLTVSSTQRMRTDPAVRDRNTTVGALLLRALTTPHAILLKRAERITRSLGVDGLHQRQN